MDWEEALRILREEAPNSDTPPPDKAIRLAIAFVEEQMADPLRRVTWNEEVIRFEHESGGRWRISETIIEWRPRKRSER